MSTTRQNTLPFLSPRTSSGSFILSIAFHGALVAAILIGFKLAPSTPAAKEEEYLDLGYQTFEAPPEIVKEEQKVRRVQEQNAPVEKNVVQESTAKELQDSSGEVAGTQKAAPAQTTASEGTGNATATPYYKIKHKYPKAALAAGIEGWVLMKVDVTEEGTVENIEVIDGEQKNVFQQEARRAVSQWKYKPFVNAAGQAVKRIGHQVRVDFKLVDSVEL